MIPNARTIQPLADTPIIYLRSVLRICIHNIYRASIKSRINQRVAEGRTFYFVM